MPKERSALLTRKINKQKKQTDQEATTHVRFLRDKNNEEETYR